MTLAEFLILLLIAAVVGSLGQALAGYYLGGCFISIVVGFVGAVIGVWLAGALNLPDLLVITVGTDRFPVIWSIIGAAIFALVVGQLTRRRAV
jgi:uncharacterized membrane protein YeaQ/YmgE (transglycosylase-associated protein family)